MEGGGPQNTFSTVLSTTTASLIRTSGTQPAGAAVTQKGCSRGWNHTPRRNDKCWSPGRGRQRTLELSSALHERTNSVKADYFEITGDIIKAWRRLFRNSERQFALNSKNNLIGQSVYGSLMGENYFTSSILIKRLFTSFLFFRQLYTVERFQTGVN